MNCLSCDVMMPELEEQVNILLRERERILGERDMAIRIAKMLLEFPKKTDQSRKNAEHALAELEIRQKGK